MKVRVIAGLFYQFQPGVPTDQLTGSSPPIRLHQITFCHVAKCQNKAEK